jgi:hypothetical protein
MTARIGRNDPCPCGSQKKYKKCCGKGSESRSALKSQTRSGPSLRPLQALDAAIRSVHRRQFAEQEWRRHYGNIRPCLNMDFQQRKFVAAGKRLYYSGDKRPWKYVLDFLLDYIPMVFGKDWFESEVAKPESERHPLFQWRVNGIQYLNAQPTTVEGHRMAFTTGSLAAYASFAFNLFAIEDNSRLDELLLERLKNKDQFQGARHEVFAEATCLRAGFSIEREDERDRTKRHAEFAARHKTIGQQLLSVEAKSKHRPGLLGQPGTPQPYRELSLRFGGLLNDAIAKNPPHPLVVFLDTNLPYEAAKSVLGTDPLDPYKPSRTMRTLLDRDRKEHGGVDRYAMLVFTNHPHHYVARNELDPRKHFFCVIPQPPQADPNALRDLYAAVQMYGDIPREFPPQS